LPDPKHLSVAQKRITVNLSRLFRCEGNKEIPLFGLPSVGTVYYLLTETCGTAANRPNFICDFFVYINKAWKTAVKGANVTGT
jgi:hypothetical protein